MADGRSLKLYTGDFFQYLWPAYAITVNKSQSATFNISYSVWKFGSMDKHSKYTALTRASHQDLIK